MCKRGNSPNCTIHKFLKHVRNSFVDERGDETFGWAKWIHGGGRRVSRRRRTGDISSFGRTRPDSVITTEYRACTRPDAPVGWPTRFDLTLSNISSVSIQTLAQSFIETWSTEKVISFVSTFELPLCGLWNCALRITLTDCMLTYTYVSENSLQCTYICALQNMAYFFLFFLHYFFLDNFFLISLVTYWYKSLFNIKNLFNNINYSKFEMILIMQQYPQINYLQ